MSRVPVKRVVPRFADVSRLRPVYPAVRHDRPHQRVVKRRSRLGVLPAHICVRLLRDERRLEVVQQVLFAAVVRKQWSNCFQPFGDLKQQQQQRSTNMIE